MKHKSRPIIAAIVAMAENRIIGKNNQLPWHLPADLKHFKAITTGHPIIMGRKTYESIGKPLPNRTNIVITHDQTYQAPGCIVLNSLEAAIEAGAAQTSAEIFIIGGANIYRQAMPLTQRLYLTVVHHTFDGDASFPELNSADWIEITREDHPKDTENPYDYSFLTLEKIPVLEQ